jgi:hypothetical protein
MADQRLIQYIKQLLQQGYNPEYIRSYLMGYGYQLPVIDDALRVAIKPKPAVSNLVLVAAVVVALIVVISGVILIMPGEKPADFLKVQASAVKETMSPGDNLDFNVEITTIGEKQGIKVSYYVIDSKGNKIATKDDSVTVVNKATETTFVTMPADASGTYTFVVDVSYKGFADSSSFSFSVRGKEAEAPETLPGKPSCICDDQDICTRDICDETTDFVCRNYPIVPCCGNKICESEETSADCQSDCESVVKPEPEEDEFEVQYIDFKKKIEDAVAMSKTDYDGAINICGEFTDEQRAEKDACYESIYRETSNIDACDKVFNQDKKDACYMDYALNKKDNTICEKIFNNYLRGSCNSLA